MGYYQEIFFRIPSTTKDIQDNRKNEKYTLISKCLRDEIKILIQIAFVIGVSAPYMKFLTVFQSEGPLIHNIQ